MYALEAYEAMLRLSGNAAAQAALRESILSESLARLRPMARKHVEKDLASIKPLAGEEPESAAAVALGAAVQRLGDAEAQFYRAATIATKGLA